MKSALFVDFDNVFSQLRQLQPDAAERFARHPSDWIGWLTSSLALPEPHEEGERRRLLVRRCYLIPTGIKPTATRSCGLASRSSIAPR